MASRPYGARELGVGEGVGVVAVHRLAGGEVIDYIAGGVLVARTYLCAPFTKAERVAGKARDEPLSVGVILGSYTIFRLQAAARYLVHLTAELQCAKIAERVLEHWG